VPFTVPCLMIMIILRAESNAFTTLWLPVSRLCNFETLPCLTLFALCALLRSAASYNRRHVYRTADTEALAWGAGIMRSHLHVAKAQ
jgi:hypothetical protein